MMSVNKGFKWGEYRLFRLYNKLGTEVDISDLGGTIVNYFVKDKDGNKRNIVLGYDVPDGYLSGKSYIGCIVGPWANRINNSQYEVDGKVFKLEKNEGENHLHGASANLGKKRWEVASATHSELELLYTMQPGDAGYPYEITFNVIYKLNDKNELSIDYKAEPKGKCPINLTQHSYFNLCGQSNILDHQVQIYSDEYLEVNQYAIPINKKSVDGTDFDLRKLTKVKDRLCSKNIQIAQASGFDHCWCFEHGSMQKVASVFEASSGLTLVVSSDQNGLQFYTGNYLKEIHGRNKRDYKKYDGLCMETQCFPDQLNMNNYQDCFYDKNTPYLHRVIYRVEI